MEKRLKIRDLIEFLEKNFKREDKLCFFDEGGAYCELEGIPQGMFGGMFWNYVEDEKLRQLEKSNDDSKQYVIDSFKGVNGNDVLIY